MTVGEEFLSSGKSAKFSRRRTSYQINLVFASKVGGAVDLDISRCASSGNSTVTMTTPCDFLFETVVAGPSVVVFAVIFLGEGDGKVDDSRGCWWQCSLVRQV